MMARGHPRDARVEGVQERPVALPPRIGQANPERRPHHEALHLRLHDAIGASRPGQSDLIAPHRDEDYPRLRSGHQLGLDRIPKNSTSWGTLGYEPSEDALNFGDCLAYATAKALRGLTEALAAGGGAPGHRANAMIAAQLETKQ
jgi:hypothetical protein